ncbi:hypothetical protein NLU13_1086 [Sarocladium strictum]|uniref:RING-type E3 ubiquitin transferase n=1 Tax=Sarocladium strictum TaxID=5046 RepID=A0AA39GR23_SARSR|nr:hypothetical protein NLU13_1086 [Sarocladium strictum]
MAGDGEASSATRPRPENTRGRGGRGRGRGGQSRGGTGRRRGGSRATEAGNDRGHPEDEQLQEPGSRDAAVAALKARMLAAAEAAKDDDTETDDGNVCFICANPVAHRSIAPCNHSTCHICGLRMRALYKTKDCAHCRTPAPFVIFTDDVQKRFEDYSDKDITTADNNIGIKYTNEDIVGDTVLLLRYNCPEPSCDFAGLGWPDLHRHVRTAHRKRMCDLCTRNKKVFTHEHELFSDKELEKHMRHGDDKPGSADQTGFKGHPLCGFCDERFYDDDKLYEHCRMKHERCFICDRRDSRHPHYYLDYNALEDHFKNDHFLCNDRECMEKKFVVFEADMDLQAHKISEHSGRTAGRDARLVDISGFDIRQPYQQERRGGRSGDTRAGRGRGRGRDQNADIPIATPNLPLRRDEIAFQRQMAIHSAQSVTPRTFGGQLSSTQATSSASRPTNSQPAPRPPQSSTLEHEMNSLTLGNNANLSPEERARLVRHSAVVERAGNLLGNDARKMGQFREHISSYRQSKMTAPQLIDAFFTLFADTSSNALGTLVREVADLFENKSKADALRKAWQDWRAINEDYPSLPGLSGMHGATTSSSGWATAATANPANPAIPNAAPSQQHSNRVLRLKNSTRLAGPGPVTSRPSGWVASSAAQAPSSSAFPSLSSTSRSSSTATPSWTGSSTQSQTASAPRSRGPRVQGGQDAFPALPAAPKPTTTIFGYGNGRGVIRDYGARETGFQWGTGSTSTSGPEPTPDPVEGAGGSKKGGKKNKKQVLVQWG